MPPRSNRRSTRINFPGAPTGGLNQIDGLTPAQAALLNSLFGGKTPSIKSTDLRDWGESHTKTLVKELHDLERRAVLARNSSNEAALSRITLDRRNLVEAANAAFYSAPMVSRASKALMGTNVSDLHIAEGQSVVRAAQKRLESGSLGHTRVKYNWSGAEHTLAAELRAARGGVRSGSPLGEDERQYLQGMESQLKGEIAELHKEFRTTTDEQKKQEISYAMAAKSNFVSQISAVLRADSKETKSGLEKTVSFLGNMASALSVGALATKFLIQDPFKYETMPAINAISKQGAVGAVLGQAMADNAQYELGLNQTIFGSGMTIAGTALGGLGKGGLRGLGGSIAGTVAGGVLGWLGISGKGVDMLREFGWAKSKEDIMGVNIAQSLLDPNTIVGRYRGERAGLLGIGATSESGLGYYYNQEAADRMGTGTGNYIYDQMLLDNPELTSLGHSRDTLGPLLSQASMMLTGRDGIGLERATTQSARISAAFGMNPEDILGMMSSAQGFGSRDIEGTISRALSASRDADGNITNYAADVITQSMLNVVHSLKLQNISRNSEELEKEVFTFRQAVVQSGTPLGDMLTTNPELFSRLMGDVQSGVKQSLTNPAMMAWDLSLGSSFSDVVQGSVDVMMRRMTTLANQDVFSNVDLSDPDSVFSNQAATYGVLRAMDLTGMRDIHQVLSLLAMARGNEPWDAKKIQEMIDGGGKEDINERVLSIVGSTVGKLDKQIQEQVNAMATASQSMADQIIAINDMMKTFITEGDFMAMANRGMQTIFETIQKLLKETEVESKLIPGVSTRQDRFTGDSWGGLTKTEASAFEEYYSKYIYDFNSKPDNSGQTPMSRLAFAQEMFGNRIDMTKVPEEDRAPSMPKPDGGMATGGFTGVGDRMRPVNFVHGGEYVISDNNVRGNRELLDRIQSGEDMSRGGRGITYSNITSSGDSVELTMRISGISPEKMREMAYKAAEEYALNNRLNYS